MLYAEIKDSVCVNVVEADSDYVQFLGLVELPDGFWIGDYYVDSVWSHPDQEPVQETSLEDRVTALESAIERGLSL